MRLTRKAAVSEDEFYSVPKAAQSRVGPSRLVAVKSRRPAPLLLLYVGSVCAIGLALVVWAAASIEISKQTFMILGGLLLACLVAEFMPTRHRLNGTDTPTSAIQVAGLVLFGQPLIILAGVVAMIVSEIANKRPFLKLLFNAAQTAIFVFLAGLVYHQVFAASDMDFLARVSSIALSGATLVIVNSLLLSGAVSLSEGLPIADCFLTHLQDMWLPKVAQIALGFLIVVVYENEPLAVIVLAFPFLAVHYAMKITVALRDETRSTIEALADAVDKRDSNTFQHSQRVARYAEQIARTLGLPTEEVELIRSAARIHDVGKIAVADSILNKPGPLTLEERDEMKRHPATAASIVESLSMYKDALPLIRLHHERYDGAGYPDGRPGDRTPLGARILAVADAFDAMTSNRPYRQSLEHNYAIAQLVEHAGKQFDPNVVRAFVGLLGQDDRLDGGRWA